MARQDRSEANVPRELAQVVNGTFLAAIGRTLSVNDNYGSETMRQVILDEVNGLRRFTLRLVEGVIANQG